VTRLRVTQTQLPLTNMRKIAEQKIARNG